MKKIIITLLLVLLTPFVSAKTPWEGYPYNSSEIPVAAIWIFMLGYLYQK